MRQKALSALKGKFGHCVCADRWGLYKFFRTSKQTLHIFIENIEHICDGGTFVETQSVMFMGIEGYILHKINLDAWIKLGCSVYLMKHKTV